KYAAALLNVGGAESLTKARDLLAEVAAARPTDARALFQLSQAQRRLGEYTAAEATARRVIALNARSVMGYYALATALEERRQYQALIDAIEPAAADFRSRAGSANSTTDLGLLLPHLGFAYQELGNFDKAIATFDEAHTQ